MRATPAAADVPGLDAVVAALRHGELACFATETLWSLSCLPEAAAVANLRMAKERPTTVPLALGCLDLASVAADIHVTPLAQRLAAALLPGPVTLVVNRRSDRFQSLAPDRASLGIRVPSDPIARAVLGATGPVVMTSANRHGDPDPVTLADLRGALGDAIPVAGDGVPGTASTVVDCTGDAPQVLREGAVSAAAIAEAWTRRS